MKNNTLKTILRLMGIVLALSASWSTAHAQRYEAKQTNNGFGYYEIKDNYGLTIGIADASRHTIIYDDRNIVDIEVESFSFMQEPVLVVRTRYVQYIMHWNGRRIVDNIPDNNSIRKEEKAGHGYFVVRNRDLNAVGIYDLEGTELIPVGAADDIRISSANGKVYFVKYLNGAYEKIVDYKGRDLTDWTQGTIYIDGETFYVYEEGYNRKILAQGIPSKVDEIREYTSTPPTRTSGTTITNSDNFLGMNMTFQPNDNPFHLNMEFQPYQGGAGTARTQSSGQSEPSVRLKAGSYSGRIYHHRHKKWLFDCEMSVSEDRIIIKVPVLQQTYTVPINLSCPKSSPAFEKIPAGTAYTLSTTTDVEAGRFAAAIYSVVDGEHLIWITGYDSQILNESLSDNNESNFFTAKFRFNM